MRIRYRTILCLKRWRLTAVLLGGLLLLGCTQATTLPRGWSSAVLTGDTILVNSMKGELLALKTSDGGRLWSAPLESLKASGGAFGCAPASTVVVVYGTPAIDGGLVYIGGYNGIVYAFDTKEPRTEPRWVYPRQGDIGSHIVGGPIVALDKVYFATEDGKVYALNASDGFKENNWPFDIGGKVWSTPTIDGNTMFVGSFDKKLYALDVTNGSKKWEFATEGAIVSSAIVADNTVFFGSFDRHIYAVNVASGEQVWKFPVDEGEGKPEKWFWTNPVVNNSVVYFANLDGKVYALNAANGAVVATFDLGGPISSSPALVDGLLIVTTESGAVYSIDTATNQQRLLVSLDEKVYASLTAGRGNVYIRTVLGNFYGIDVRSGARQAFDIKS